MNHRTPHQVTTGVLIIGVFAFCVTLNGNILPWQTRQAYALDTISVQINSSDDPSTISTVGDGEVPDTQNGGPAPVDSNNDGKIEGWDVDGDGGIDVADKGDGILDTLDSAAIRSYISNKSRCGVDLEGLSSTLANIGGYFTAAGIVASYFFATGVGAVIAAALLAIGAILSLFGGTNYEKELYKEYTKKELKCDPRTRTVATEQLLAASNRIMVLINSGGERIPGTTVEGSSKGTTWVNDWRSFVRGQQDEGRRNFQMELYNAALGENATICKYFADSIANTFGTKFTEEDVAWYFRLNADQAFDTRVRCSLPDDFDITAYLNGDNFSWDDYERMLEVNNTPLGVWLAASNERQNQIDSNESINREDLVANQGFRGIRDPGNKHVVNPGSVLSKLAAETITKQLDYLVSADEVGELIGGAVNLTVSRVQNLLNETLKN